MLKISVVEGRKQSNRSTNLHCAIVLVSLISASVLYEICWLSVLQTICEFITALAAGQLLRAR